MIEQLCIKKLFLKEPECISCKGYDCTCPSFEEIKSHYDNPMEEEQVLQQHKYTTEEN